MRLWVQSNSWKEEKERRLKAQEKQRLEEKRIIEERNERIRQEQIYKERLIKDYEEDVLVLPLTTSLNRKGIIIKSEELVEGELKKGSIVITNKPFFISKSLLIRKIGKVSKDKFFSIKHELCNELNCYRWLFKTPSTEPSVASEALSILNSFSIVS